jgi:hypothetical protein
LPPKPKWMRWRTYNRYVERYDAYEDVLNSGIVDFAAKFMGAILNRPRRKDQAEAQEKALAEHIAAAKLDWVSPGAPRPPMRAMPPEPPIRKSHVRPPLRPRFGASANWQTLIHARQLTVDIIADRLYCFPSGIQYTCGIIYVSQADTGGCLPANVIRHQCRAR